MKRYELFRVEKNKPDYFLCFYNTKTKAIRNAKNALETRWDMFEGETIIVKEKTEKQIFKVKLKRVGEQK
jgi:hypothetical protein